MSDGGNHNFNNTEDQLKVLDGLLLQIKRETSSIIDMKDLKMAADAASTLLTTRKLLGTDGSPTDSSIEQAAETARAKLRETGARNH